MRAAAFGAHIPSLSLCNPYSHGAIMKKKKVTVEENRFNKTSTQVHKAGCLYPDTVFSTCVYSDKASALFVCFTVV